MQDQVYKIVYLLTNLFNLVSIHRFMLAFFEKRRTDKRIYTAVYALYFVLTSAVYLLLDIPILTIFVNIIILFIICLNYENDLRKCSLCTLFIFLFLAVPELIVGALTGYFEFSVFTKGDYSSIHGIIVMRLLTYVEALLFQNFRYVRRNKEISVSEWIAALFIPFSTWIMETMITESESVTQSTVVLSVGFMLLINVIAFYLYDSVSRVYVEKAENALLKRENELYSKQCEMMQTATEELQDFRHNLKNRLIGLKQLMNQHEYDKIEKLLSEVTGNLETSTLYSTTGNLPVDAVINYKLQSAAMESIAVKTEIAVPADLMLNISEVTVLLGNLLDNALEAVRQLSQPDRYISLKVVYSQNRLIVQVSNPFQEQIVYENGEIATTKNDPEKHGYGIKSVEKIVNKYDGYMEINHDNMTFTVDILLYIEKRKP